MPEEIEAKDIAPGQEVEVGLLRPQDAPGVAALFRAVYGTDYPVKTYYQPQALREANQRGEIISVVARTPRDEIVGHNGFYRIAPCAKVYEGGAGLVLPAYRNTAKLFSRMVVVGIQAVPGFGGEGIFGEQVCNHLITQKAAVSLGNITMGLEVDLMPAETYEQEGSAVGRVSSLTGFQTLQAFPHAVFLPPVYDQALRFLYQGLNEERRLETADQPLPRDRPSRLSSVIYDHAGVCRITAGELGGDLEGAMAGLEAEAQARGVVVIQVWLPLAVPWVGAAVEALRGRGFFLGGLLPRWFDQDGLLMQRLAHTPDWEAMQILLDRSRAIMNMVREDWRRVTSGA